MSLRYERGVMVRAATRGDGTEGEDVTANIRTLKEVPQQLKGRAFRTMCEIRGEVYMTKPTSSRSTSARRRPAARFSPTRAIRPQARCARRTRRSPRRGRCISSLIAGARSARCRPIPSPA